MGGRIFAFRASTFCKLCAVEALDKYGVLLRLAIALACGTESAIADAGAAAQLGLPEGNGAAAHGEGSQVAADAAATRAADDELLAKAAAIKVLNAVLHALIAVNWPPQWHYCTASAALMIHLEFE